MSADLWGLIVVSLASVILLVFALCDTASDADDRMDEWALDRAREDDRP